MSIDRFISALQSQGKKSGSPVFDTIKLTAEEFLSNIGAINSRCEQKVKSLDKKISILQDVKKDNNLGQMLLSASVGASNVMSVNKIQEVLSNNFVNIKASEHISGLFDKGIGEVTKSVREKYQNLDVRKELDNFISRNINLKFDIDAAVEQVKNLLSVIVSNYPQDVFLLTVSQIAKKIISENEKKLEILDQIEQQIANLYNQLRLAVNGEDVVTPLLIRMRYALYLLVLEEERLRSIRNSAAKGNAFRVRSFRSVIKNLEIAQEYLSPAPSSKPNEYKFVQDALNRSISEPLRTVTGLSGAAASVDKTISLITTNIKDIEKETEERIQALYAMGSTMELLARLSAELIKHNTTINVLINQFLSASENIIKLSQSKYYYAGTIKQIDSCLLDLNSLIDEMAEFMQGLPNTLEEAASNAPTIFGIYRSPEIAKKRAVVLKSGDWTIALGSIIAVLKTINATPDHASELLKINEEYFECVQKLREIDTRTLGSATMTCEDSKEAIFELPKINIRLVGVTTRALRDFETSPVTGQFFKSTRDRVKLSKQLSLDIIKILTPIAEKDRAASAAASRALGNIKDHMRRLGLDRFVDLLNAGEILKIYESSVSQATYAGNAITAINSIIGALKDCPAAGIGDIQILEEIRNEIKDDEIKHNLNVKRIMANNITIQRAALQNRKNDLLTQCEKSTGVAERCVPRSSKQFNISEALSKATGGIFNLRL